MSSGANRLSQVWTEMIMGLPISIHLRSSSDPAALMVAVESAFARLREADLRFSPYRHDSELTKYVLGEFELEFASAAFRSVLNLAETARQFTDGAFDVRAGGTLDPSGLVKGWAAEQAAQTLPANHYLNAGGDITMHSTSMPWRIGIEHPEDPTGLLAVVSLGTGGIATSGSTHRGTHHRPDHRRSGPGHQASHRHRPQPDERGHLGDCAGRKGTAHLGPRRRAPQQNGERRIPGATGHRRRHPVCHRRVLLVLRSRPAEAACNPSQGQIAER